MAFFNRVMLIGTIAGPIEVRWVRETFPVAGAGLHIVEDYKDRSGNQIRRETVFDLVAYGDVAVAFRDSVKVGDEVYLQGRIRMEEWMQDGNRRQRYMVVVERVERIAAEATAVIPQATVAVQTPVPVQAAVSVQAAVPVYVAVEEPAPAAPEPAAPEPAAPEPARAPPAPEDPARRRKVKKTVVSGQQALVGVA